MTVKKVFQRLLCENCHSNRKHGEWDQDMLLDDMLKNVAGEFSEVLKAVDDGDIFGPHGIIRELEDLGNTVGKTLTVMYERYPFAMTGRGCEVCERIDMDKVRGGGLRQGIPGEGTAEILQGVQGEKAPCQCAAKQAGEKEAGTGSHADAGVHACSCTCHDTAGGNQAIDQGAGGLTVSTDPLAIYLKGEI